MRLPPLLHDDLDPIFLALQITCCFAKPPSAAVRAKLDAAMPPPLRALVRWGATYVHALSNERPHDEVRTAYPAAHDNSDEVSDEQWDAYGADAARWIATCHAAAPVVFAMSSAPLAHPKFDAAFARGRAALDDVILPDLAKRFGRERGKARSLLHTIALRVAGYALSGFVTSGIEIDPELTATRRARLVALAEIAAKSGTSARDYWVEDVLTPLGAE